MLSLAKEKGKTVFHVFTESKFMILAVVLHGSHVIPMFSFHWLYTIKSSAHSLLVQGNI